MIQGHIIKIYNTTKCMFYRKPYILYSLLASKSGVFVERPTVVLKPLNQFFFLHLIAV